MTTKATLKRRNLARRLAIESLECRHLMAFDPTGLEQEALEHLNRMRTDPAAELDVLFTGQPQPLVAADAAVQNAIEYFQADGTALQEQWADVNQDNGGATRQIIPPAGEFRLFADASLTVPGLAGSYVDQSLQSYSPQDDWRITQPIAGTRLDLDIDFLDSGWGDRAEVGLTGGTDENWEHFSVQWDGYIQIVRGPISLATRSDDGSRMWIDINGDGLFEPSAPEFVDNNWGSGQAATTGPVSPLLESGAYRIRIQYEESAWGNIMQLLASDAPMVRAAYLVPSNRMPQADALDNLRETLVLYQDWYRDQMERYGFGRQGFRFETEDDGVSPRVHVVPVAETDEYLRGDVRNRVREAASAAGVPWQTSRQIWLLVPEIHLQNPDGSIAGTVASGPGSGSCLGSSVAMIDSGSLAFMDLTRLVDDAPYDGRVVPEIGPYPLVQGVSFPRLHGTTFSSVASSALGATLYELTRSFRMPYDFRNDSNLDGNLMGRGARGFRGAVYPERYPHEDCFLSYGQALALSTNRYFEAYDLAAENLPPRVVVNTFGLTAVQNGLLPISVTAADDTGLAAALLVRNGYLVDEIALSGTSANHTFTTPYYVPGQADEFSVIVYDVCGNRGSRSVSITPESGTNRAPQPLVTVSSTAVLAGQTVDLDASRSTDPDHPTSSLLVEWDLDGDGIFDTAPTTDKLLSVPFHDIGTHLIQARLTDASGAWSLSAPLAIRVGAPEVPDLPDAPSPGQNPEDRCDVNGDRLVTALDALIVINHVNANGPHELADGEGPDENGGMWLDVNGDRHITAADSLVVINRLNTWGGHRALPQSVSDPEFLDVNRDWTIDHADAQAVLDYLSGTNKTCTTCGINESGPHELPTDWDPTTEHETWLDVNGDGCVTAADAHIVIQQLETAGPYQRPTDDAIHDAALTDLLETAGDRLLAPLVDVPLDGMT